MVFKVHRLVLVFLVLLLLLGANFVYALEINYPKVPGADPPQDFLKTASPEDVLSLYVKYIVYFFIWLSGFLAFAMLVYGGIGYLTASGSPEKMVNAKQQIFGAFLGILILFSLYFVLNAINPNILQIKIPALTSIKVPNNPNLPELNTTKTETSIDIEIPFGRIINNIFEEYVSEYPKPTTERLPRMTRITNNTNASIELTNELKKQGEDLKNLSYSCKCEYANPICSGCSIGGVIPLTNFLDPTAILEYDNIIDNISNTVGIGNLKSAFDLTTDIAGSVGNIKDFSNTLNFASNIANTTNLVPKNLNQVFASASNITSIANNPSDLFGSIGNIASFASVPENLTQVFSFAETAENVIKNPANLNNMLGAVKGISEKTGESLDKVFQATESIENITKNSDDLKNIFSTVGKISDKVGLNLDNVFQTIDPIKNIVSNSNDLNGVFNTIQGISEKTGVKLPNVFEATNNLQGITNNSKDLQSIFGTIENISNKTGDKLTQVFQSVEYIKNITEKPQGLKSVFGSVEDISNKVGYNLESVFQATSSIEKIAKNTESLENIFGSIKNISNKTGGDLKNIFNIVQEVNKTAKNPGDLIETLKSKQNFTELIHPEHLSSVLNDIKNISNNLKNPQDLININTGIQILSQKIPNSGNLTYVLEEFENISGKIKIPSNLSDIQKTVQSLSNTNISSKKITSILGDLGDISGMINSPADLGNIKTTVQELTKAIPIPDNLNDVLGNLGDISGMINSPADLGNIKTTIGQLSGAVPQLENFKGMIGGFQGISGIIQNPTNLTNVMGSFSGLAQITPLGQFPDVLGQIDNLGGLFQSPKNIIDAFVGTGGSCSCDPCVNVRSEIQETEEKNISAIYDGTSIEQLDKELKSEIITTSLTKEIVKTEKEVSLLKEELDKLNRAKKAILGCPLQSLNSWTQFTAKKDEYENSDNILRNTKFWDNINIKYFNNDIKWYIPSAIINTDYATFYCSVSGTAEQGGEYSPLSTLSEDDFNENQTTEEIESIVSQNMSCPTEVPVGEIIDRTQRVAQLLIDKLETLVGWEKKLIKAVDELQIAVSQCTSQKPRCRSVCTPVYKHGKFKFCIEECVGSHPCETNIIDKHYKEIQDLSEEIKNVIEGKATKDTPDTIGIINIVDKTVPGILNDLEKSRGVMQNCSVRGTKTTSLFRAEYIERAYAPTGQINTECQIFKIEDDGTEKLTTYGQCFNECYLEIGQAKHRICVQKCLDKSGDEEFKKCVNELDFYCCHI